MEKDNLRICYRNRITNEGIEKAIKLLQAEREGKVTKDKVKKYVSKFDINY